MSVQEEEDAESQTRFAKSGVKLVVGDGDLRGVICVGLKEDFREGGERRTTRGVSNSDGATGDTIEGT